MKIPSTKDYYTIFIAGLGKYGPKHFAVPAKIVDNYRKYAVAGSLFILSLFVIGILFFSNYKNALSTNKEYAYEIERLKKENELLDADKFAQKVDYIEDNIGDIRNYLKDRGFITKTSTKTTKIEEDEVKNILASNNNRPASTKDNVKDNVKEKFNIIDYYYSTVNDISHVIRDIPLGIPYHGRRTSGYGPRGNPFNGRGGEMHKGVDMRGPVGDDIKTTSDGVVVEAGRKGGYGNAVIVQHKFGLTTLYGHMSKLNVTKGQIVKAGDVIGYLGSTGRSTGPHLHYEVRLDNKQINPDKFIKLNY